MQGHHRMGDGQLRGGMGPHMMLMMMALVDTDASGTLSLEKVQAVDARMFQYADTDDDGELTIEELRAFMHGEASPSAQ
jgi:EF hand